MYVYIVIRLYNSFNLYIVYDFVVGCEKNLLKNNYNTSYIVNSNVHLNVVEYGDVVNAGASVGLRLYKYTKYGTINIILKQ